MGWVLRTQRLESTVKHSCRFKENNRIRILNYGQNSQEAGVWVPDVEGENSKQEVNLCIRSKSGQFLLKKAVVRAISKGRRSWVPHRQPQRESVSHKDSSSEFSFIPAREWATASGIGSCLPNCFPPISVSFWRRGFVGIPWRRGRGGLRGFVVTHLLERMQIGMVVSWFSACQNIRLAFLWSESLKRDRLVRPRVSVVWKRFWSGLTDLPVESSLSLSLSL